MTTSTLCLLEGEFYRLFVSEVGVDAEPVTHPGPGFLVKLSGADGEFAVNGTRTPIDRASIVFFRGGEPIALRALHPQPPLRSLLIQVCPDWLAERFPSLELAPPGGEARPDEPLIPRIRQLADAIGVDALNHRFLTPERTAFVVQELVLSIVDAYFARRASSPVWTGSRYEDSRIRRAIALLRARPNKETNMDVVAGKVGLSRSRFYYLFQACTGRSPRDYLDMLCTQSAILRLALSRERIADLSSDLGFSAQSNFTRFFLNQVGVPPSQYRRAARNAGLEQSAPAPEGSAAAAAPPIE